MTEISVEDEILDFDDTSETDAEVQAAFDAGVKGVTGTPEGNKPNGSPDPHNVLSEVPPFPGDDEWAT